MEHFVVSARKYRPQTFKDVVGQEAITNTLKNAIENNHLAQALLFTGPRGVGKTTCARILAKMINSDATTSDDEDFSFNIFELDAASNNSVDDIRNLTDQVRIPPQVGNYKVYIIDEVHMLSAAAFNAFLKTLEEPPKHCIFILATTEKHKIIPTILSRCQIFDFKRITVTDAKAYLKYIAEEQGIEAEDDALHIIAQKADGAMRDALSIFDRVVSFTGKQLTRQAVSENLNVLDYETYFKSTDLIIENNIPELLLEFDSILSKGFDGHHYIAGLASHFRDLLVCKNEATIPLLEVGETIKQRYIEQSRKTDKNFLLNGINIANECDLKYKSSKNQRLLVELSLMQIASITFDGEKKNSNHFIIPPAHFKEQLAKAKAPEAPQREEKSKEEKPSETKETSYLTKSVANNRKAVHEPAGPVTKPSTLPKPTIKTQNKAVSGLSLKSIKEKRVHELKQMEVEINEQDLPREPVKEDDLIACWNNYSSKVREQGKKNLATVLDMDIPRLEGTAINVTYGNETNKMDLESEQYHLMSYLRKQLKNFDLSLEITVKEEVAEKFIYTPHEKYERLKEKNKNIELLKKTFGLDL